MSEFKSILSLPLIWWDVRQVSRFLPHLENKHIAFTLKGSVCAKPLRSCLTLLFAACQAPLSMAFSRQECWNGLLCPPPGDLPDPGIEPASLMSPALAGSLSVAPPGKPLRCLLWSKWWQVICLLFLVKFRISLSGFLELYQDGWIFKFFPPVLALHVHFQDKKQSCFFWSETVSVIFPQFIAFLLAPHSLLLELY